MDLLHNLAVSLDKPGFNWKGLVIGITAGQWAFSTWLRYRQYKVLQRPKPPVQLQEVVEQETFDKSQEYGRAKSRFGFVSSLYGLLQNIGIIHFDVLPKLFTVAGSLLGHGPKWLLGWIGTGMTTQSIVFFLLLNFVSTVVSLPMDIYETFVLEEKFGFNKQTPQLFATDLVKTQLLTIVLGSPVIAGMLGIINKFGDQFFYFLWLFFVGVQVAGITIYPTLIQPLFNKLTPLEDGELKSSVESLAQRLKFPLTKIYVVDGSKRSSHSNAYFFGLPWKKQIVLFDTLIEKQSTSEVTAVMAHEIGHWALSHLPKMMAVMQAHLFSVFALFSSFIHNKSLYNSFGFYNQYPILVGFILFSDIITPLESIVMFFTNLLSRSHEYQADAYAAKLGLSNDLAQSLIALHIENLSTMDADWLFSAYHHSHPILSERLRALDYKPTKKTD